MEAVVCRGVGAIACPAVQCLKCEGEREEDGKGEELRSYLGKHKQVIVRVSMVVAVVNRGEQELKVSR